jgi:hypothetical protein
MKKLLLGVAFLALAAVAFANVKTDYNPSARFGDFHTFAWRHAPAEDNSLVRNRVHESVSRALVTKGLRENKSKPDVVITYTFTTRERSDVDRMWSGWHRGPYRADVYYYTEGILTLDMIDKKTDQVVWRAYGTTTGNDPIDVQSEKKIEKLVSDAFKKFPPEVKEKG